MKERARGPARVRPLLLCSKIKESLLKTTNLCTIESLHPLLLSLGGIKDS